MWNVNSIRLYCRWSIHPVRLLHQDSNWYIYDSSISITYSKFLLLGIFGQIEHRRFKMPFARNYSFQAMFRAAERLTGFQSEFLIFWRIISISSSVGWHFFWCSKHFCKYSGSSLHLASNWACRTFAFSSSSSGVGGGGVVSSNVASVFRPLKMVWTRKLQGEIKLTWSSHKPSKILEHDQVSVCSFSDDYL